MVNGIVNKVGKKWVLIDAETEDNIFIGLTRVSCFRYAYQNQIKIVGYSQGGVNRISESYLNRR